jgi:curved DNA-binding protein CbpA
MKKENFENYYQILGLSDFASIEEVKKRWEEIKQQSDIELKMPSEKLLKDYKLVEPIEKLLKAYSVLSNPILKSEYDVLLKASYEVVEDMNSSRATKIEYLTICAPILWFAFQAYFLTKEMNISERLGYALSFGFIGMLLGSAISIIIAKFYKYSIIKKIAERNQIPKEKLFSFLTEIRPLKKEVLDEDLKSILIGIFTIFILFFSIAYPESLILIGKKPISLNKAVEKYWYDIGKYINGTINIKACKGFYPNDDCYDVEADILNGDIKKIHFRNGGSLSFDAHLNQNGEAQDFDKSDNLWYFSIEEPYGEYSIIREGIKLWAKDNNYVITNEDETPKEVLPAGIPEDIKNWQPEKRAEFLYGYFKDIIPKLSDREIDLLSQILRRRGILTDEVEKLLIEKIKKNK